MPGLSCEREGIPAVIRGEETQALGALQLLGLQDGLLVLPGTHSKWVTVKGGRITDFSTAMTGEFYALLRQHSLLARSLPDTDGEVDWAAFDEGVAMALRGPGLLQTAFSVRTRHCRAHATSRLRVICRACLAKNRTQHLPAAQRSC